MKLVRTLAAALMLAAAGAAQASVVSFAETSGGFVSTSFADGTFTHHLSGDLDDGFFRYEEGIDTRATNFYGYNNEAILFNQAVTFNSLQLGGGGNFGGATLTASLFDGADNLLAFSTIDNPTSDFETLLFDVANTRKLVLSFTGGSDLYGLGFNTVAYKLDNVTYTVPAPAGVPEPASLALFGLGAAGLAFVRRRKPV